MRIAVRHLKKSDPVLSRIIERAGPCRIQFRDPDFDSLARSIVFQQLSGKAASTIFGRLAAVASRDAKLAPQAVLRLTPAKMRRLGLSRQKSAYLRDLARRTVSGEIRFDLLPSLPDEAVIEQLTQIKGVGVWTAHMFLIFALRRTNVLPTGDLGIQSAVRRAFAMGKLPTPASLERLARNWQPYCSVASWYLGRSLEFKEDISTGKAQKPAKS